MVIVMYKFDLEKELPLSPIELLLKEYYFNRPEGSGNQSFTEYVLSSPDKDWANNILSILPEPVIKNNTGEYTEDLYIPSGYDVAIYKHSRYSYVAPHSHSYFEIVCVMNGSCINHIESQKLEMNAGDICIIAPKTQHTLFTSEDGSIILNLLVRVSTFDKSFFGTLAKKDILASFFSKALYGTTASETYILFPAQGDEEIENYIVLAYEEFNGTRIYKEEMLNSIISMFFITLLRNHEKDAIIPHPAGKLPENKIIAILNYIQMNYSTVTIAELSSTFNYSERHITRILKEYTGDSFLRFVQKIKFYKAADLLSNSNLSIKEIAEITGHAYISHFYRMFHNYYQMTPVQYREKNHKNSGLKD